MGAFFNHLVDGGADALLLEIFVPLILSFMSMTSPSDALLSKLRLMSLNTLALSISDSVDGILLGDVSLTLGDVLIVLGDDLIVLGDILSIGIKLSFIFL
ncbi:MAG: hypothetical protein LBR91_00565 [Puniceicoccales bacterium]|nr:hypothetical protein [Puniceicoccales bacterium]